MKRTRAEEIIALARDVRSNWGDDPVAIAQRIGIRVVLGAGAEPAASILQVEGYPPMIRISGCSTVTGRRVMCAHELGHAFLHEGSVNRFSGTMETIVDDTEYEANLFAVAYLFDGDEFAYPMEEMSNYMLKSVLDYNIR